MADRTDPTPVMHGAVIVFKDDMTKEECEEVVRRMNRASLLQWIPDVRCYNPDQGFPIFYIP